MPSDAGLVIDRAVGNRHIYQTVSGSDPVDLGVKGVHAVWVEFVVPFPDVPLRHPASSPLPSGSWTSSCNSDRVRRAVVV